MSGGGVFLLVATTLSILFVIFWFGEKHNDHVEEIRLEEQNVDEFCVKTCEPFQFLGRVSQDDLVLCVCDSHEGSIVKELER